MPSKNNVWGCSLTVFVIVLLLVRPCLLIQTDRHCNLGTAKNFAQVGGKFSLTTVVRIGCQVVSLSTCNGFWHQDWSFISQVIERLRAVHEVGLVYRWALLKHFVPPVDIHSLSLVLLCKLRCIYKMHIFSRDVKPANLLFFCSPAICLFVACVTVCLFLCLFLLFCSHVNNHFNILNRDVKPENLLVGSPGTPTESIIHMVPNIQYKCFRATVCTNEEDEVTGGLWPGNPLQGWEGRPHTFFQATSSDWHSKVVFSYLDVNVSWISLKIVDCLLAPTRAFLR